MIIGGVNLLRANGQGGSSATVLAAYFAKRNTKFGGAGKARAGKNSFPPTQYEKKSLLGFCFSDSFSGRMRRGEAALLTLTLSSRLFGKRLIGDCSASPLRKSNEQIAVCRPRFGGNDSRILGFQLLRADCLVEQSDYKIILS